MLCGFSGISNYDENISFHRSRSNEIIKTDDNHVICTIQTLKASFIKTRRNHLATAG